MGYMNSMSGLLADGSPVSGGGLRSLFFLISIHKNHFFMLYLLIFSFLCVGDLDRAIVNVVQCFLCSSWACHLGFFKLANIDMISDLLQMIHVVSSHLLFAEPYTKLVWSNVCRTIVYRPVWAIRPEDRYGQYILIYLLPYRVLIH